jgi:rubrerythrin
MQDLTLRKSVELAITTEQLGADFYARMERKFSNQKELREIFAQLVKDEKAHEAQFKTILKGIPEEPIEQQQYELYQYLRATAISEFFRDDAFKNLDSIKTADDALGRSLAFEKSTLQFYQAIRDILGKNQALDEIINAEKTHVIALMKVITADAKFRGLGDKW